MPVQSGQRIKLIKIIDILKRYSDEEHPINAIEIANRLEDMGISAERKSVYNDIELLIDYGYDICKTRLPRTGYFLASRDFEIPEIYMLSDAVKTSDFITAKKTRELLKKLYGMLSVNQEKAISKNVFFDNGKKSENEEIYYNIDSLNRAIIEKKKVSLIYFNRKINDSRKIVSEEKVLKVSPYALIWQNDKYYLVCNNEKYDNLMHIRVERMKKVTVTDEDYLPFSSVSEYKDEFDVADYVSKSFSMFTGKPAKIELRCDNKIAEQLFDRFSDKIFITKVYDNHFSVNVDAILSEGLVNWLMQFGDEIEVVKPDSLRDMIKNRASKILKIYK